MVLFVEHLLAFFGDVRISRAYGRRDPQRPGALVLTRRKASYGSIGRCRFGCDYALAFSFEDFADDRFTSTGLQIFL